MSRRLLLPALALLASWGAGTSNAHAGTGKALVSFGDSYASGQGQSDATGVCARSPSKSYPALLGVAYGVQNDRADFSCAGAKAGGTATNDLPGQVAQAQAAGVLGTNTVAVTITIGGNDNVTSNAALTDRSLYQALAQCAGGSQGSTAVKTTCNTRTDLLTASQISLTRMQSLILPSIATIRSLIPASSKIVLAGYPAAVSTLHPNGCNSAFNVWLYQPSEVSYLDNLQSVFAQTQKAAVSGLTNTVYANLFSGSQGQPGSRAHDLCAFTDANPQPWILSPIFDFGAAPVYFQAKSLHPNDAGMSNAVAPIIAAYNAQNNS